MKEINTNEVITQNVLKAKNGDKEAVKFLYETYYKDVYYTCFQYLKNESAAKDITQDVFLKAFEKIKDLNDNSKFKSWICQIAGRTSLNYLKREKIIDFSSLEEEEYIDNFPYENGKTPEDVILEQDVAEILLKAINKLPQEQKICIFMFYYENLSIKEIAERMDCSENTIRGKIRYAHNNLRKYIDNLGDEGIKLKAIGILPFLYLIFDMEIQTVYASINVPAEGLTNASANTIIRDAEADAMNTAGTRIKKTGFHLSKGATAGILSGVVVAAIIATPLYFKGGNDEADKIKTEVYNEINTESKTEESGEKDNESETNVSNNEVSANMEITRINHGSDVIMYGKYVIYYDNDKQTEYIVNLETGEPEFEITSVKRGTWIDKGNYLLSISDLSHLEGTDEGCGYVYMIPKDGSNIYMDEMYIKKAGEDSGYLLGDEINHYILHQDKNLIYLSKTDDGPTLKSISMEDANVQYEKSMPDGYIYTKNEKYICYSDIENEKTLIINGDDGSEIASFSKREYDGASITEFDGKANPFDIRLMGEYYSVVTRCAAYTNEAIIEYRRYSEDSGEEPVIITFSPEEEVIIKDMTYDESSNKGSRFLVVEKKINGETVTGIVTSDFTEIVPFGVEEKKYCGLNAVDNNSKVYYTMGDEYQGYVILDDGAKIIKADFIGQFNGCITAQTDTETYFINQNNGKYNVADDMSIRLYGKDLQKQIFVERDYEAEQYAVYDENANKLIKTEVPLLPSVHELPSAAWNSETKKILYYDGYEAGNLIYMFDTERKETVNIETEGNVHWAFLKDEDAIIYAKSDYPEYVWIEKDIKTGQEMEIGRSECEFLYDYSKYGFVIGEEYLSTTNDTAGKIEIISLK